MVEHTVGVAASFDGEVGLHTEMVGAADTHGPLAFGVSSRVLLGTMGAVASEEFQLVIVGKRLGHLRPILRGGAGLNFGYRGDGFDWGGTLSAAIGLAIGQKASAPVINLNAVQLGRANGEGNFFLGLSIGSGHYVNPYD